MGLLKLYRYHKIMFQDILFVCTANICRSPVGEYLLKQYLTNHGHKDCHVASAGTHALVNEPAVENSQKVMLAQSNIEISTHRAQQVTQELMKQHDLILVMETHHKKHLEQHYPFAMGKIQLLGKWRNEEIDDPYRLPYLAFEKMHGNIARCLKNWTDKFWPQQ